MKIMKDPLGERMKSQYEDRYRFSLPRRTYTILRLDGKAFHTYTRRLQKPFDKGLIEDMDAAIVEMIPHIQGAVFAYTQSDEISILLTDFTTPNTDAWFDGNLQKMVSVSASMMTGEFNRLRWTRMIDEEGTKMELDDPVLTMDSRDFCAGGCRNTAHFDSRAFTIPDRTEVMNYFRWRQQDCIRNSISMVGQANFSHQELHGKSQSDIHEMLHQKGVNWTTDFTNGEKNGRIIFRENYQTEEDAKILQSAFDAAFGCEKNDLRGVELPPVRTRWTVQGAWVFTQDEGKLLKMIPTYP